MKKIDVKLLAKKLVLFFLGVWIIQTGVAMFIKASIGSDPFTVFTQGLSGKLGVSVGMASTCITATLIVIIAIVDWRYLNIGTILSTLVAGPFINLMTSVFKPLPIDDLVISFIPYSNIIIKSLFLALSCVVIAIGFSLLKSTNLGVAANDIVPLLISDKTKLPYSRIRIPMDITFVVLGFLLGGIIGIGTLIGAFLTGPVIEFFMPRIAKFVAPFLKSSTEEIAL
ncbi:DUF6198 family protein [Clostridium sp. SHJSY1]|uniref:YczE/YyaS/YitT family protein n=1 Tax=Clostridium sp. SHJSY1 TaxID=2942483 RepID=UPI00287686C9|nr:DUF6198 family protein [Clostridium sp. SHJSY1]MDS0526967.1 DUF6198 family protein [Clostridium sp. SHJSY1]